MRVILFMFVWYVFTRVVAEDVHCCYCYYYYYYGYHRIFFITCFYALPKLFTNHYIFLYFGCCFLSSQNYRKLCKRDNLSILIATKTKQFQLLLNTSRVWHWIFSFCLFLFSLLCLIVIDNTINKNKNKKNKTCHRSLILAIVINFCKKNSLSHK